MPRRKHSRAEMVTILRRASAYLKPYTRDLVVVFCLIIIYSVLSLLFPRLMGKIVDAVSRPNGWHEIEILLVIYAVALVLRSLALMIRNHLMQTTGMKVTCDMRIAIFAHLQKLSLKFYEERQTGSVVARVTDDGTSIFQLVTGASVTLIADITTAGGVLIYLFFLNWKLAFISVFIIPLFLMNYRFHRRRMRMESRRHSRNWVRVVGFLNERIANSRVIRAFATEEEEEDAFRYGIQADYDNWNKVQWRNTLLSSAAEFLSGIGQLLALGFGAWLIIHDHEMTTGDLFAFLGFLGMLYQPIVRVFDANVAIQRGVTAAEKIFAVLDTRPHIPDNDELPEFPRMKGKIEFRNVTFGYRIGQETLAHVQFTVEPGEMIALVGASGAGKSTIITLLSRFYDPTSGQVLIDDRPITDYNVQSVRRQIGIVMQDNILFSGSIADNIRYGRPEATQAEIIAAARAANAHDFILEDLRRGYDSRVGERGVTLSGGQRQRIAIARVLLKDPRILILDEATSALDSQAEKLIQEATEKLMLNRTAIVIAHRLSTVINANRIFVMDKGRIVDMGRHGELLARPGIYRDLYQLQFAERKAA